ncbi:MAG: 30S ribosomal protein S8e [Candidatus Micrarchaeota archaeon]|nr:30S ribosomal protein S8e [Candidatus Micrarchaeota archaeon]
MSQFGSQIHRKSNTKSSGSGKKTIKFRDKRRSEMGNYFSATKVSEKDAKTPIRRRGGNESVRLKHAATANVLTKTGYKKAKITGVAESKDNRNFARQAIITKGSLIATELGNAVVLNRPGREGFINARLV